MKRIFIILSVMFMAASCFDVGNTATQKYTVVANFDNGVYKFSSDSTFFNTAGVGFSYDLLGFFHQFDADGLWFDGGFALSCLDTPKSGSSEGLRNTYRAYLTKGFILNGNAYAVFYENPDDRLMPEHDMKFLAYEDGTCTMLGCYVANTAEVAEAVKKNFKEGDKLTLKATGYRGGSVTGEAQINLAEYTAQKDSIVSRWTAFELKKLGDVEYVDFDVISTNDAVPGYFCLDSVVATIDIAY